jgi:hypothetical protein
MNIFRLPASLNGLKRVKIPSWISVSDGLQYSMKINSNGLRYSLTSDLDFGELAVQSQRAISPS